MAFESDRIFIVRLLFFLRPVITALIFPNIKNQLPLLKVNNALFAPEKIDIGSK